MSRADSLLTMGSRSLCDGLDWCLSKNALTSSKIFFWSLVMTVVSVEAIGRLTQLAPLSGLFHRINLFRLSALVPILIGKLFFESLDFEFGQSIQHHL